MRVRITKCSYPMSWYRNHVGEIFEVEREGGTFNLAEDMQEKNGPWRFISDEDCEIVDGDIKVTAP